VDEACGRMLAEDVAAGGAVVSKGFWLRAQEIGLFAACDIRRVSVVPRPHVAILEAREDCANRAQVAAMVRAIGCPVSDARSGGAPRADIEDDVRKSNDADVFVFLTGGAADENLDLALTLQQIGVRVLFGSVPMEPGGQTLFGLGGRKAVFGFSNDPVGVLVNLLLFLEPALQKLSRPDGRAAAHRVRGVREEDEERAPVRTYEPVRLEAGREGMVAQPVAGKNGPDPAVACRANAFAILEPGREVKPGDPLSVLLAE